LKVARANSLIEVVQIVHGHGDAGARVGKDLVFQCARILAHEADGQFARTRDLEVGGAVLVAIGVAPDDDRLGPAGNQPRHVAANDWFAEDNAAQNVADRYRWATSTFA
jgi:hypothetical protein